MAKITRISTVIRRARKILEGRNRWCKNSEAIDRQGAEVPVTSPEARAYCASGALQIAAIRAGKAGIKTNLRCEEYLNAALPPKTKYDFFIDYNDALTTTKKQILALFDRAAKLAERDEWRARKAA